MSTPGVFSSVMSFASVMSRACSTPHLVSVFSSSSLSFWNHLSAAATLSGSAHACVVPADLVVKEVVCAVLDQLEFRRQPQYRTVPRPQTGESRSIAATFCALCWEPKSGQFEDPHCLADGHLLPCRPAPRPQTSENHSNAATSVVVCWVLQLRCAAFA